VAWHANGFISATFVEKRFPWLLLSLLFTAALFFNDHPEFRKFMQHGGPGNLFFVIMVMRVWLILNFLNQSADTEKFASLEFIIVDVSESIS
jgi:hypothetical protein